MRLADIKHVTAHRGYIKLMLQLEYKLHGSSYFRSTIILSPSPVAASIAIVCGRCAARLVGNGLIVARRANASSTKCRLF